MEYDIKDLAMADQGQDRVDWALGQMPVVRSLMTRFEQEKPLQGLRIGACLHVTTETANLARTLKAGGAEVALCASNPLSTQDDVAATLVKHYEIPTFAVKWEDTEKYYRHLEAVIAHHPQITLDDGADLVSTLHQHHIDLLDTVIGGTEETTTGVIRLRAMAEDKALKYPIIAVNDAYTKHLFDNRYGTGQSTLDGVIRATNILIAGRVFCVVGYGWCGRGIAMRARGLGANVLVTEVEPIRALEAAMDGFSVMPLKEAAKKSDFIITATGDKHVVDQVHFDVMKDGCIMANSGHFDVEINIPALENIAVAKHRRRQYVDAYTLGDGRTLHILAEGRLVNLSAAEGHPAAVMDMSFANQALCIAHLAQNAGNLDANVHTVPAVIDNEVARLKLIAMAIEIDELTAEQKDYLKSWQQGT